MCRGCSGMSIADSSGDGSRRRATSFDVAELAGVSRSAVSLVLNGRAEGFISAENQEAVRQAAAELGYRPNRVARSLRVRSTRTIGVITDTIVSGAFGGAMMTGAGTRAARDDYLLFIMGTEGRAEQEEEIIGALQARQVDALMYAAEGLHPWAPSQAFRDEPNILLDAVDPTGASVCVVSDEETGGYRATRMLLDAGHRRIAYLHGTEWVTATGRRMAGHDRAMAEAGLRAEKIECGWEMDRGLDVGTWVLDRPGHAADGQPERPTAVLCANDRVAAGVLLAAARLGLQVPQDVSIVGYDNDPNVASQLGLSTVCLPYRAMGERAMDLLVKILAGHPHEPGEVRVDSPAVKRISVAPPMR